MEKMEEGEIADETIIILDDDDDDNQFADSIIEVNAEGKRVISKPKCKPRPKLRRKQQQQKVSLKPPSVSYVNLSDEDSNDSVEVIGILCANPAARRRGSSSFEHVRKAVAKARRTVGNRKSIKKSVVVKPKTPKIKTPARKGKKRGRMSSIHDSFNDSVSKNSFSKAPDKILFSTSTTPSMLSRRQKKRLRQSSDLAGRPFLNFDSMGPRPMFQNPFQAPSMRVIHPRPLLPPNFVPDGQPMFFQQQQQQMHNPSFPINPGRRMFGPRLRMPRLKYNHKVLQHKNYSSAAATASSSSEGPGTSKAGKPRPIIIDGSNVAVG